MSANPVLLNVEHLKIRVGEHGPLAVDDLTFRLPAFEHVGNFLTHFILVQLATAP